MSCETNLFKFDFALDAISESTGSTDDTLEQIVSATETGVQKPHFQRELVPEAQQSTRIRNEVDFGNFEFVNGIGALIGELSKRQLHSRVAIVLDENETLLKIDDHIPSDHCLVDEIEEKGTDIIPGRYGGGLKVWECSLDLCRYIWNHKDSWRECRYALEIGCGHGLPSCLLLRISIREKLDCTVFLTDLNDFVLKGVTVPNIILNARELQRHSLQDVSESVVIGAGDWLQMSRILEQCQHGIPRLPRDGRFDLVLAAETTYTAETSQETAILLAKHIAIGGAAIVATKRYYFGCGGGSDSFRDALSSQQVQIEGKLYRLCATVVHIEDGGFGNIRELLKVVLVEIPEPLCSH